MPAPTTAGYRVAFVWALQSSLATSWTENFWCVASNLTAVYSQASALKTALNAVHGTQVTGQYIRIAAYPKGRKIQGINFPTAAPGIDVTGNDTDFPTTAVLFASTGDPGNYTQQWIKGIPDGIVKNAGRYTPGGTTWPAAFAQLRLNLITNDWAIRIHDPAATNRPILSINAQLGLITAPAHGFPANTTFQGRISGVKNYPVANGLHYLYVAGADTLQYTPWTPAPTGFAIQGAKMSVTNQTYIFQKITEVELNRITKKNVGRPTRVLSGAKKRRRSA